MTETTVFLNNPLPLKLSLEINSLNYYNVYQFFSVGEIHFSYYLMYILFENYIFESCKKSCSKNHHRFQKCRI